MQYSSEMIIPCIFKKLFDILVDSGVTFTSFTFSDDFIAMFAPTTEETVSEISFIISLLSLLSNKCLTLSIPS